MGVSYNRFLDRLDRADSRRSGRIYESSRGYGRSRIYESQTPKVDMSLLFRKEELEGTWGHIFEQEAEHIEKVFREAVNAGMKWLKDVTSERSGSYKLNNVLHIKPNSVEFNIEDSGLQVMDVDMNVLASKDGVLKYFGDAIDKKNSHRDIQKDIGSSLYKHINKYIQKSLRGGSGIEMDDGSWVVLKASISLTKRVVTIELYRED